MRLFPALCRVIRLKLAFFFFYAIVVARNLLYSDMLDIFSQLDDLDAPNSGRQMFDVDRQMANLSIDNNNRIGSSNIKLGPVITKKVMSQNSASTLNTLKKLPSQPAKARATSERGQMPPSLRKVRSAHCNCNFSFYLFLLWNFDDLKFIDGLLRCKQTANTQIPR